MNIHLGFDPRVGLCCNIDGTTPELLKALEYATRQHKKFREALKTAFELSFNNPSTKALRDIKSNVNVELKRTDNDLIFAVEGIQKELVIMLSVILSMNEGFRDIISKLLVLMKMLDKCKTCDKISECKLHNSECKESGIEEAKNEIDRLIDQYKKNGDFK